MVLTCAIVGLGAHAAQAPAAAALLRAVLGSGRGIRTRAFTDGVLHVASMAAASLAAGAWGSGIVWHAWLFGTCLSAALGVLIFRSGSIHSAEGQM